MNAKTRAKIESVAATGVVPSAASSRRDARRERSAGDAVNPGGSLRPAFEPQQRTPELQKNLLGEVVAVRIARSERPSHFEDQSGVLFQPTLENRLAVVIGRWRGNHLALIVMSDAVSLQRIEYC
jgi:hypothetical protein